MSVFCNSLGRFTLSNGLDALHEVWWWEARGHFLEHALSYPLAHLAVPYGGPAGRFVQVHTDVPRLVEDVEAVMAGQLWKYT
jgi:hypothetical protein